MKILIVDDYHPLAESIALGLESVGHTVTIAADGMLGLHQFRRNHFDAVLSDWNMPRMNGPEMVREILRLQPNVKVVMMSGEPWNKPPEGIKLLTKGSLSLKDVLAAFND